MLTQIITHTPLYVWAILAFLMYRGVIALRDREMAFGKMFIIPVIMLALSLQDISHKFGIDGMPLAAWAVAAVATGLLVARLGRSRVAPGATPGQVLVRGSRAPLVLMMAIFMTKYITAVAMAIQPQLIHVVPFATVACALSGCFNGYFMGRLGRDVIALRGSGGVVDGCGVQA
jgi:hypothetical protein